MVYLRVLILTYFSFRGTRRLHEQMVDKVINAPVNTFYDVTPLGRLLNRFSKDLSVIESTLVFEIGTGYVNFYNLFSVFGIAVFVVPWILLIFPCVLVITVYLYRSSIAATKETSRIESVTRSPLLSFLSESINGQATIRAFDKSQDFIDQNYKLLNRNILATQWQNAVPLWFAIRIDLVSIATMCAIGSFCVLFREKGNPVMLAMLLSYSVVLQQYVISTIRMMMQVEARMVNADRCLNLLTIPQESTQGYMSMDAFKRCYPDWPSQGEVEFSNVSIKYRPSTDIVLEHLDFKVEAGERIGVVGRTGAGKSTLCLSFSRMVEIIEGSIQVDGVDIKSVELEHLRKMITVIPQDPTIFSGTLKFNLDPEDECNDQRIMELLRAA